MKYVFLCIGLFLGTVSRFLVYKLFVPVGYFPMGTFLINIAGSFLIGFVLMLALKGMVSENIKIGITTGVIGAFTTFSTFSFEVYNLINNGFLLKAVGYIIATIVGGLFFIRLGSYLGELVVIKINNFNKSRGYV